MGGGPENPLIIGVGHEAVVGYAQRELFASLLFSITA
jgi:hypothetical protein